MAKRHSRRKTHRRLRRGGAATVFPLKYFNPNATTPNASAGRDLLEAIPSIGVRPRIGGGSRRRRVIKARRTRKSKGGFVPTIMDGFVQAASKFIVPLALFSGYKLMSHKRTTRRR